MDSESEAKDISKMLRSICDCDQSHKINSIANWVELRERYYHGAVQLKEQNKLEKAHHYFHHAILCDPKHVQSYEEIIHILIELKKFHFTNFYLKKLNDISPEHASILKGHVFFAKNQFTNSEIQLKMCLNLNPNSQSAIYLLGFRNFLLNRLDESKTSFEKLLKINPNHLESKFFLANINMFKGNFEQAIEDFNKILLIDFSFNVCYYQLALCYNMLSNYDTSIQYCEAALKHQHLPRCYDLMATNFFELNNKTGFDDANFKIANLNANGKIPDSVLINNILVQSFDLLQKDLTSFNQIEENLSKCRSLINAGQDEELNSEVERIDYYSSIVSILKSYQSSDEKQSHFNFPILDFKFHTNSLDTYKIGNYLYLISLSYLKKNKDSQSLKYIDQAIKLNENNINFYLVKNLLFLRKKNYYASVELLKHALKNVQSNNFRLRYFLCLSYLYLNRDENSLEQLNYMIPKEFKELAKTFCDFDLSYEIKCANWMNTNTLFDPIPKLIKEKYLTQHHKYVMNINKIKLLIKLDFNLYFDLKCVNYLLLKAILKYETSDHEYAKNVLKKAERLESNNLGVCCYLGLIYLRQEPKKADYYIQKVFDLNRDESTSRKYCLFYRNKMSKYILDNPEISQNLSDKSKCLLNVSFDNFDKSKKLFNKLLQSESVDVEDLNKYDYLKIYEYLINNLHAKRQDHDIVDLTDQFQEKFKINFEYSTSISKPLRDKSNLYNGISNFNLKNFEKAKQLLNKSFTNQSQNLMAGFYLNIINLRLKAENLNNVLKNFENLLNYLNSNNEVVDLEFNKEEILFFILESNFKLKNYEYCSSLMAIGYESLILNKNKLVYTKEEVAFIKGILFYLEKNYQEVLDLFRNLNTTDAQIQNEINFHKSICFYKINSLKPLDTILEAYKSLEMIPNSFKSTISESISFIDFKFKCLFYIIFKSWSTSTESELNLYLSKLNKQLNELDKQLSEAIFYYLIIINSKITHDFNTGLKYSQEATQLYPNNRSFFYYAGWFNFKLKKYQESKTFFDDFIKFCLRNELDNNSKQMLSNSYYYMAQINQNFDNYKKSIEYFDLALENNTNLMSVNQNERRILIHEEYSECDLYYLKSLSYLNLNEHEKCINLLNKILETVEKDSKQKAFYTDDCKLIIAKSLLKTKNYRKALKTIKKVINLRNDDTKNQVFYYTAVIYHQIEEYSKSLSYLNELPEDFDQNDCGDHLLIKLKCLFFLILKYNKSSQPVIRSKFNLSYSQFNDLINSIEHRTDLEKNKNLYSILVKYKIDCDYEKTYKECSKFAENSAYLYYAGIAKFRQFLNLKNELENEAKLEYLKTSELNLEKYISLANKNLNEDLKIKNCYYYLSFINFYKNLFSKSNEYLNLFNSVNIDNLKKFSDDDEKFQYLIDVDEFSQAEVNYLNAIVLFSLNRLEESLGYLNKIETDLNSGSNQASPRLGTKSRQNILNAVMFYSSFILLKQNAKSNSDLIFTKLKSTKAKYNYFNESKFLLGLLNYELKNFDECLDQLLNLNPNEFHDYNFKTEFNYYLIKTLFIKSKPEILSYNSNSKHENQKLLNQVILKSNQVLLDSDYSLLDEKEFEILCIKLWSIYFTCNYEELVSLIENKCLLDTFPKNHDFMYLYSIGSILMFYKSKNENFLDTSFKNLSKIVSMTEHKESNSFLSELLENHELEKYLTVRFYLANILTSKKYLRYEEGIKLYIEILYHNKLKPKDDDINSMIEECLSDQELNKISKYFGLYREFDLYDIIYNLGISLNEIKMYQQSFKMLNYLVSNFKLKDENKLNEVNFYLGLSKFKLEDYKNASEYFSKYKPSQNEDDNQREIPKIELAKYYIGICLYNKTEPDFLKAFKKFKEISNEFKDKDEFADLAHYLISSNYKLALGYLKSNSVDKWNEYFSFTLDLCNEYMNQNTSGVNMFEIFEKKSLSLYLLKDYDNLNQFLEDQSVKNFQDKKFFHYIQTLCLHKIITTRALDSAILKAHSDQAIKSIQNFMAKINEKNEVQNKNKILNLKFIKTVIYLNYPDTEDKKFYLSTSVDLLKEIKQQFDGSSVQDEDLIVFNMENLEYQESIIYFMTEDYENALECLKNVLDKAYFKNDELKLSEVYYYLGVSMIKLIDLKKVDINYHEIIKNLKNVKKESIFYAKSKFYISSVLFEMSDYSQSFEYFLSFEKCNESLEDDLKLVIEEYKVKIPFYLANQLISLGNRADAIEKFKFALIKSDLFLKNNQESIEKLLNEENDDFYSLSNLHKILIKILYFKAWCLLHVKMYQELNKFVKEYSKFSNIINDFYFLEPFSVYKQKQDFTQIDQEQVCRQFERYLIEKSSDFIQPSEGKDELFEHNSKEKHLISLLCLSEMSKNIDEKKFFYLNELLFEACGFECDKSEFTQKSLSDIIKKCRQSQLKFLLNELNFADVVYNWYLTFYKMNLKQFEYAKIHSKLADIKDEFETNANFFNQTQKDSLNYFYSKSLWENYVSEKDLEAKNTLKQELQNVTESLKKIKLSSEYYTAAMTLLAELNYELDNLESLDKSIYFGQKVINKNDSEGVDNAKNILINAYARKLLIDSDSDVLSADYKRFNELFEQIKLSSNPELKENCYLNKLKVDLKCIKYKNDKSLDYSLEIARQAYQEFSSNYEILFLKAKIEYLTKAKSSSTFDYQTSLTSYLHYCTSESYPNSKYDIQEAEFMMLKLMKSGLDEDDPRDRYGYSHYVSKLISQLSSSLANYKSDSINLNEVYYEFGEIHFKEENSKMCIEQLCLIEDPEKVLKSQEYNIGNYYFMLGMSEMRLGENYTSALKYFEKVPLSSDFYHKSLLGQFWIYYKTENYEYIAKNLSTNSTILSEYNYDFKAYIVSSKFWYNFNDYSKLVELNKELEIETNKTEIEIFYSNFVKVWIGLANNLSDLEPNINAPQTVNYGYMSLAAFRNTNEIDFINGLLSFVHKNAKKSFEFFTSFLKSSSNNKPCLFLSKFYLCHVEYHLNKNKWNNNKNELILVEKKLKNIIQIIQNEILESDYLKNIKKDIYLFISNLYYELLLIEKSNTMAEKTLENLNKCYAPSLEYDDFNRLKASVCFYYQKNYKQALDNFAKIRTNDVMVKYYSALCFSSLNDHEKALSLLNSIIQKGEKNKLNDLHFQRGLIYFQLKDYQKALVAFIDQIRQTSMHYEANKNILECVNEIRKTEFDLETVITDLEILKCLIRLLFEEHNQYKFKWIFKLNQLINELIKKQQIDEYQIFFSYEFGSIDKVVLIHDVFSKLGLKCFIDKENLSITSDKLKPIVEAEIKQSLIMLNFLTPEYCKNVLCNKEVKFGFDNELNMMPVILKKPDSYSETLRILNIRKANDPNGTFPDLNLMDFFAEVKPYLEDDYTDLSELKTENLTEEELLNNHLVAKILFEIIELIFED